MVGFLPSFSPSSFRAQGVRLNGSSQYFSRIATMSVADGSEGTVSFWCKVMDNSDALFRYYLAAKRSSDAAAMEITNAGSVIVDHQKTWVHLDKQSGTSICQAAGNTLITADGLWHHQLVAWKTNNIRWYLDGNSDGSSTSVPLSGLVPYSGFNSWYVGFYPGSPDSYFNVELAELWFDPTWIDLTVATNRAFFRTAAGKPADLGNQGQLPLGTQPLIYLSGGASTFGNNKGSGGSFNPIGSPTNSATSPSD